MNNTNWLLVGISALVIWWLFFRKKYTLDLVPGSKTPVSNLGSNLISSLKAQDQVLKVVENIPSPDPDTSDSMIDGDPVTQNVVLQGEYINAVRSNEEKILLQKDYPDADAVNKSIPQQRDQKWWPNRMYTEAPEWLKNTVPCECGCGELIYKP